VSGRPYRGGKEPAMTTANPAARRTISTLGDLRRLLETIKRLPDDAAINFNLSGRAPGAVVYWPDLHVDKNLRGNVMGHMVCFDVD